MITNKSNVKYEIIVNEEEKEQIRNMLLKNGYPLYVSYCEFIVPRLESKRWSILFTRKQYELFKMLWNETKKSRKGKKENE